MLDIKYIADNKDEIKKLLEKRNQSDFYFNVEKMIEPDSRKRHKADPWYNMWDYTPKFLKMYPATIIFKCKS